VHLVREPYADLVEHIEDRVPAVREVLVAGRDPLGRDRREHRDVLPDRRAGEADHRVHAELGRGPRGVLQVLGRPLPDTFRIAVAPHPRRHDRLVPEVDRVVADRLADQMVGDREDLQVVLRQDVVPALDVGIVLDRLLDVEMVTRAGDLDTVVPGL
jgi:hypothetical protein